MTPVSLNGLHATLDALRDALEEDRHDQALQLMSGYEQDLRAFMAEHGRDTAMHASLHALLGRQDTLLERMRQSRDEAASHLRQLRQSSTAAHAYRAVP